MDHHFMKKPSYSFLEIVKMPMQGAKPPSEKDLIEAILFLEGCLEDPKSIKKLKRHFDKVCKEEFADVS